MIRVTGLDHIVLRCADVERSLAWYTTELGLAPERVDEWRRGEVFFPSVRITPTTIIDLLPLAPEGHNIDHFCVVVDPIDLDAVKASGRFEVVEGPAPRWGAQGQATSLYVRDPDGNTVELRCY
ncbi:MAG TPA: VOC family protein [Acidimicrobiia bacterium]|nr:VOC family protein [Acidimicrobiia bacterium]